MMNRFLKILIVVLFIGISYIGLSDVIVTYKSGECKVDLYGSSKWKDLSLNMKLNEKSVIKTGHDGEVEIKVDGEAIIVGGDTRVNIKNIIQNLQERKKLAWFSKLSPVLRTIVGEKSERVKTAFMGVRAIPEGEGELDWMGELEEEDPVSRFENGKELYNEGSYVKAINIFKDVIDTEELSPIREEVAFYLGSSMFNNMQYEESLGYLDESMKDKNAYFYEVALLNASFAYYFMKNYPGAIESFKIYTKEFNEGDFKPYALLMLGKSHKALGEKEKAKSYFHDIEASYMDTEVYSDALNEMQGL